MNMLAVVWPGIALQSEHLWSFIQAKKMSKLTEKKNIYLGSEKLHTHIMQLQHL